MAEGSPVEGGMNNLRNPVYVQELEAVIAEIPEKQSLASLLRQEYDNIRKDLEALTDERAHVETRVAPDSLLTARFRECINAALSDLDASIRAQSERLQPTEERLREVEKDLKELRERRQLLNSRVSPVQVLPEEILVKIWNFADAVPRPIHSTQLPFILSWVNKRWREILTRTPTLWRFIQASPNMSPGLLQLQVQRSAPCLLKILFSFRSARPRRTSTNGGVDRLLFVMTDLIKCADRWQSFHLGESSWSNWEQVAELSLYSERLQQLLCSVHVPHLQHFCAWWQGLDCLGELFEHGAPSLAQMQLSGLSVFPNLHLFRRLTSLELIQPDYDERLTPTVFRSLLAQCPTLTHLGLDGNIFHSDPDFPSLHPYPLPLTSLTSLKLSVLNYSRVDGFNIPELFQIFIAPRLESLQLLFLSRPACEGLMQVLEKSPMACGSESLFRLHIHAGEGRIGLGHSLSSRMLVQFPNIQHLWINAPQEDGQELLEALALHMGDGEPQRLCPSLDTVTLDIGFDQVDEDGGDYIRNFVATRQVIGLPITTLRFYPEMDAYAARELLAWCHEIVKVEVLPIRDIEFECCEMSEKPIPAPLNLDRLHGCGRF
ncbi:hypothetical protein GLOTRDRAFT_134106 [Gloeophyllum trabeum ATCC 11539]|uniref:F-box domain-containing protein n=1 Tax=Gloeophyllum trabeum (strain ATCC 11539 / FP-39264 / Madison 617) TaxID=670483 RepID=S7PSC6_GLOTA|nr:uncharacterized protein GLOTRDRAFT_134106 [Gloeophyllum trabeum ATCC 11539]EPQ50297.1 hypothetical protein GLOTRDRAFT_134106 [Gloeophyllum trabeum ATCC 11539]